MSIEVEQCFDGYSQEINEQWQRTYTQTFRVLSSSRIGTQAALDAVTASSGYRIGSIYNNVDLGESDIFARCIHASAKPDNGDLLSYTVTVEFGPMDPRRNEDPLQDPPDIAWSFVSWGEKVLIEDVNGDPIRNTAYDYFDPPISIDDIRPHLSITRNEADFDPGLAYLYRNTLNQDTFFGTDAGIVKCSDISAQQLYDQNASTDNGVYYKVSYEFDFDPETKWQKKVPNLSLVKLDDGTPPKQVQITEKGQPVTKPKMLDEDGHVVDDPTTDPHILTYDVYPTTDFSVFNLENNGTQS